MPTDQLVKEIRRLLKEQRSLIDAYRRATLGLPDRRTQ